MGFASQVVKILIQKWLLKSERASSAKYTSVSPCQVCGEIMATYKLHDGMCAKCRLESRTKNRSHRQKNDSNRGFGENGNELRAAYHFLGCRDTDSDAAIKKKFRLLAKQCHPDQLQDLPDYKISEANRLFQDLREAYDLIMRSRQSR